MDPVSNLLFAKVFTYGWDQVVAPILQGTTATLNSIDAILIDESERKRLIPLKEGILFLEDGQFEKAADRLITAQASDDFAAVPRLLYGLLLSTEKGKSDRAARHVKEALDLNPHIVEQMFPDAALPQKVINHRFSEFATVWEISLGDLPITSLAGQVDVKAKWQRLREYWHAIFQIVPLFSQTAIVSASANADSIVLSCLASENLRKRSTFFLLKLSDRGFDWILEGNEEQPVFASSKLVLTTDSNGFVRLRDIKDGRIVAKGSKGYYEVMLAPTMFEPLAGTAFQRANLAIRTPEQALLDLSKKVDLNGIPTAEPGFDHEIMTEKKVEEFSLCCNDGPIFRLTQSFSHWHHTSSGGNLAGTCVLGGKSRIEALSGTRFEKIAN